MNLKINNIRYKNIREFRDLELNFSSNSEPHHISLVQMPNGTGKTTTMELIRTILLGKEITEDEVRSYEPTFEADEGYFEADFETDDEVFTNKLILNYELGEFEYRHTTPREIAGGEKAGHYLPPNLSEIFNESFVDLFVFNGELTEEFLARGQDQAEDALKIINHLNRLEAEQYRIYDVVKEERAETDTNVTSEQGLTKLQNKLDLARSKYNELGALEADLEKEIQGHIDTVNELEEERQTILSENEEFLEKDGVLTEKINNIESDIMEEMSSLLEEMRHPSLLHDSFNEDLEKLLQNMNHIQLPKSTSKEFFLGLSEGEYCICGTELGEAERTNIQENASSFLSDEDIGVLNSLKDKLRSKSPYVGHDQIFENLDELKIKHFQLHQERAQLGTDDSNIDDRLSEIINQQNKEKSNKSQKKEQLHWLTTADRAEQDEYGLDWKTNLPLCNIRIKQLRQELNEASGTVVFDKKAGKLDEMFDRLLYEVLNYLKKEQIKGTNEKLEKILGLSKVEIDDIDSSIIVKDRDATSEGQGLSIAYAYLSTLFEESQIEVPFIIDSPAVSIDYDRREYVAQIISQLFDQLVIFIISPERERFVNELESDDIQYLTIHKTKTPGKVERHMSKDFFMNFQSEVHQEVI